MNIELSADGYTWNDFVEKCEMGTLYQSYEWSIEKAREKYVYDLLILKEHKDILGGAMIYWKRIPFLKKTISKIFYGPIWSSKGVLKSLCEEAIKVGEKRKSVFLEFQIYLPEYINGRTPEEYVYVNDVLLSKGFIKLSERRGTYWLNLERDEDEILRNVDKSHRRDINKGIREGVRVKIANSPNIADTFYEYYVKLYTQKHLRCESREFFKRGLKRLLETNKCKLFYAEYEGMIYNLAVISLFGNPMYVWGASMKSDRKPPMGQLLHWEIIKWLKQNNYKLYDLGGSPGAIPERDHPNYWVWRFKKGFNGDYVQFFPSFRYIFNSKQYWLYERALPLYRTCLYRKLKVKERFLQDVFVSDTRLAIL